MKRFEISMVVTSLAGLCFLAGLGAPVAHADFIFGPPVNLGPTINSGGVATPSPSADGLELYLTHDKYAGSTWLGGDIYVARRATVDSEWGVPVSLGEPVNATDPSMLYAANWLPSISADGLSLYFTHDAGGAGRLYVAKRVTKQDNWGTPVSVGAAVNTASAWQPCISADELELYFHSDRPGGYGQSDLWVTTRATVNDEWGAPVNLGPSINSPAWDNGPAISPDGLLFVFSSTRSGGLGGDMDIYMARRATKNDPWGTATNVGPGVSSTSYEGAPRVSFDGSTLYFDSDRSESYAPAGYYAAVWQSSLIPVVDFSGDGMIDAADMAILEAKWGQSDPLCDVGPSALGDGIVDEKDLKVLMESLMTPGSTASDVPCDVVLSWMGPSFAQAYDVYFGTSFDAVNNATREDPCGVLVSLEQSATVYMPQDVLELDRTYYWRVDTVLDSTTATIYRGTVVKFTTEVSGYRIRNITATASSSAAKMGPENTVNGSGLDADDGHSTIGTDMWLSKNTVPQWIQYEFDDIYALDELWVWNSNQLVEPFMGFGAKTVKIEYSTDGTTWAVLDGVPEFARAPGTPGYTPNTTVSFNGVSAKYVKLTVNANWGGVTPPTGLSEVRFFYIPARPYAPAP